MLVEVLYEQAQVFFNFCNFVASYKGCEEHVEVVEGLSAVGFFAGMQRTLKAMDRADFRSLGASMAT